MAFVKMKPPAGVTVGLGADGKQYYVNDRGFASVDSGSVTKLTNEGWSSVTDVAPGTLLENVKSQFDPVTGGVDFLPEGKESVRRTMAEADPAFPDDTIRIAVSQNPVALPCVLKRIRCVAGSGISLAVYDDVNQSTGYQFANFPQTLSAGQEATIPDGGLVAMHGVYCKFTGTATFDITVGAQK